MLNLDIMYVIRERELSYVRRNSKMCSEVLVFDIYINIISAYKSFCYFQTIFCFRHVSINGILTGFVIDSVFMTFCVQ